MDVNFFYTIDYENISDWTLGENKPNQTQFQNPANLSKEREEKRFQELFLGLSCRKGYNIVLLKKNSRLSPNVVVGDPD